MNWKFTAVFLLAGLTACAHNDNISSTSGSTSSASSASAATSGGSDSSSSYGGSSSYGSGGGGSSYGSPSAGYGGSAMGGSSGSTCDAQSVQNMIGKTLTNETTEQARTGSHSAKVRVLKPGQVMTMEYDPSRINLITDKNNALTALRCG